LFCFLLAACGPSSTPNSTSGVEGHVTVGPTCPVVQIDNPCPDKPYQATLSILDKRGKNILKFQTDANGYYHTQLAPGDYILRPESPGVMPHAPEQPFTVSPDEFTTVDVVYDSGIR